MSPSSWHDGHLWVLVGVGLVLVARVIPAALHHVRDLTEVTPDREPVKRLSKDAEDALSPDTLEKLILGSSYEIRACALKIMKERVAQTPARDLLLRDLSSSDAELRDRAIRSLGMLIKDRSRNERNSGSSIGSHFANAQTFAAVITALVNLLPLHGSDGLKADREDTPWSEKDLGGKIVQLKITEQIQLCGPYKGWQAIAPTIKRRDNINRLIYMLLQDGESDPQIVFSKACEVENSYFCSSPTPVAYQSECDEHIKKLEKATSQTCPSKLVSTPLCYSPVRPPNRPPQESKLLEVLSVLFDTSYQACRIAVSQGLISRWLSKYPFPCANEDGGSKRSEVLPYFTKRIWWEDDRQMGLIIDRCSRQDAVKQMEEYGLCPKGYSFRRQRRSDSEYGSDDDSDYSSSSSSDDEDILMADGEDTAGLTPSRSRPDEPPASSWTRRASNTNGNSQEEQERRRSRREAIVVSDGGPLTRESILQRENSRADLAPSTNPDIDRQLAELSEEIEREDAEARAQRLQ